MAQNRKIRSRQTASRADARGPASLAGPRGNRRIRRRRSSPHPRTIKAALRSSAGARVLSIPDAIPLTWLKFAIGLVLFPLCWITTEAALTSLARVTSHAQYWRSPEFWFFGMGAVMWLVIVAGLKGRGLLFLYVLGHEYTHAIFALLCGARIECVKVTSEGGHILTNKNNVLISLSPYIIPFYSVIAIALYALAGLFFPLGEIHSRILFAVIGLTWSFHLTFTMWMITKNQPDLRQNGNLFSLTLIYLLNLVIIIAALIVASPHLALREFATTWLAEAYTIGAKCGSLVQR